MQSKITVVGLSIVLVSVPLATAKHISVGASEAVGASPDETPQTPSVVGPDGDAETNDNPYEVGVSTDCTQVNTSELSQEQFERARASDAFCGELFYHRGDPRLRQRSPPDQVLHGPIGTWDVMRMAYQGIRGEFSSTCIPYCPGDPGGETLFDTLHTAGHAAGLTESPEDAREKDGNRVQEYGSGLAYPAASTIVEHETDTWRMNGWGTPHLQEKFVGILLDKNGEPIGPDRLSKIVQKNRDRFAQDRTVSTSVCGFAPDVPSVGTKATATGVCEIDFTYQTEGETSTDDLTFDEGYHDPCRSPTYVCGATGSYWVATLSCLAATPCSSSQWPTDLDSSRFHWIVAPTQSACGGNQEPGAAFDNPETAQLNFLAHDLDVYVPPTSLEDVDETHGMENAQDYLGGQADPDVVFDELSELPGLPRSLSTASTTSNFDKPHRVEPNAKTGNLSNLDEDSQSIRIPREFEGGLCSPFTGSGETEHTIDPWVNHLDGEAISAVSLNFEASLNGVGAGVQIPKLYRNQDPHQDHNNRPGPRLFITYGQAGMFTDKNDDGLYGQAPNDAQFARASSVGAYPLFYDMRVEAEDPTEPDLDGGCSFEASKTTLVENMVNAGYGPRTGLVQAVYLEEPTAVVEPSGGQTAPLPGGQTILLFESQAIHRLHDTRDPTIAGFVDRLVEGLRSHPDIPDEATVVNGNDLMGVENAYGSQCAEWTGGFSLDLAFAHQCQTGCEGDTIVTGYVAELTSGSNTIGAADGLIPFFNGGQGHPYGFPSDLVTWTDVDPFDNNPDRNTEESRRPPHHQPDENPEPRHHQDD